MQIRIAGKTDRDVWDKYVLQHRDGLAYHLFAWKLAVEQSYGWRGVYLLAEQDGRVRGVLPAVDFRGLKGRSSYISLPYCDAAGPLADSPHIEDMLVEHLRTLAFPQKIPCEVRYPVARENSPDEVQGSKVRMLLPLPDDSASLLAGFKSKLRSQVRKPIKDGLTAQLGGAELIDSFYTVFTRNMRDLGSPVHSRAWIESILCHYGSQARVAIVHAPDGAVAAAGIILLHKTTVSIPWASSLQDYNRLNPNMLLYWTFLSFAADNGYVFFDFGRSTPGEGTYRFKEQWGAQPQPLQWLHYLPGLDVPEVETGLGISFLRQMVAFCWQRLPVAWANFCGPFVRKRLSL